MNRLYKFFFLLFCAFAATSFIYATLISWLTFQVIAQTKLPHPGSVPVPFHIFLTHGLVLGLLYALVLLLFIIFLFNRAYRNGQRFTIRDVVKTAAWFYAITTTVYLLYYLTFSPVWVIHNLLLRADPMVILPPYIWYPFPLAWVILLWLLAARIKKTE